jgi:hypothetical protein
MAIDTELIDKLLVDYKRPEQIVGENGLLKQLTKAILERAMQAEMTEHLCYDKHDPVGYNSGNSRNGKSRKKIRAISARSKSRRYGIATRALSPRSCPKVRRGLAASTTRFCRCTPVG